MKISDITNGTYTDVLFIDFESRSKVDLINLGAHRYCTDESTSILLTAYAVNDEPVKVIEYDNFDDRLIDLLNDPNVLKVAHNAEFDMGLIKHTTGIEVRTSEWFDTAYQGVYYAHPRKLKYLAKRLEITDKGDGEGILIFSTPRKGGKKDEGPTLFDDVLGDFVEPSEQPEKWEQFKEYAEGDIITMREAFNKMQMLPAIEIFTMQITIDMNFNGVPFDAPLGVKIYKTARNYEKAAGEIALNKYNIQNLRSGTQVQKALMENGIQLPSLDKKQRNGITHEILELRDVASGAAFSKIPKALSRMCADGRLHGEFVGHGAHTGRWSSRGVQLHNWARILEDVEPSLENVKDYDHLRQHMRLCLGHVPFTKFTCADLSQIEARITAWLAQSKWRMEAFEAGVDIYARSAEKMFSIKEVKKGDKERQYGKNAELGFGYGGGHMAIKKIQPDFYREAGEGKVRELVHLWRSANPEIKKLWYSLENALNLAIKNGVQPLVCGKIKLVFQYDGKTGKIILPSGRALYYRGMHRSATSRGFDIAYLDYGSNYSGVRTKLWGGTILENVVQAIARDVLVSIMSRVKKRVPEAECIGTVHDEIWYLTKPKVPMLDIILEEMERPISWAKGLVTTGDGFEHDRYIK